MTDRLNNSCWTKYHRCKYLGISGDDSDMFCVKYLKGIIKGLRMTQLIVKQERK